ncbi:MAG: pyruvate:ferredoxin (flavodoxin) oxidoreductase [Chlorobiales bacterium]|nr:pyruvate:ferredoxin (flavodoxin) oxidoreductase [Chlorobiales bacterium]
MKRLYKTMDGNDAVTHVAYRTNEVIAIYPITPASPMGEISDAWASEGVPNIWGSVPSVVEMQHEGGAAAALHGAIQTGALATTFTASQGLLLMIPTMYKVAGELTPTVLHVSARSLAAQGLSIFCDHSDVMSVRGTGFALFNSCSVQEAMDFALIAQAATLESRVPFLHFFDGFRTSHEVSKIEVLTEADIRAMIDDNHVRAYRSRRMTPDDPIIRGTSQNPDVYFQARETVNPYYDACPEIVQKHMDKFAQLTGRRYKIYEYYGAPDAERIIVLMGSGVETAVETVDYLNQQGEKVGLLKIRLYRPFDVKRFCEALPETVKSIAVLDRIKEPGSTGEPLYLDCISAIHEGLTNGYGNLKSLPKIVAGRYGLSSKEFTPAMVKAIFDNIAKDKPKNHFTIGINDDVTHSSIDYDPEFSIEPDHVVRALFYGLGSDGTVGANKNSIKIIGENTDNFAQGYFVYDSKKAGSVTTSHLRFGPKPIRSTYLISRANFIGCHSWLFLENYDILKNLVPGGTLLINSHHGPERVWEHMPKKVQEALIAKKARVYVIDGYEVANNSGMGRRINTVMQVCFFAISGVLPREEAIEKIKDAIRHTYGKKGEEVVRMNINAVDNALSHLHEVRIPETATSTIEMRPVISGEAPDFVCNVLAKIISGDGDSLPVSALPDDGTYPVATAQYEKRNLSEKIPVWDPEVCIQCGKCAFVCPHSVIRMKVYDKQTLERAPEAFKTTDGRDREWKELGFTIQVSPEDCTGCAICVDMCPAKNKTETRLKAINMMPVEPVKEMEKENWEFFLSIPEYDRRKLSITSIKQQQIQQPLFEFSGACSGCGETPYVKLISQLFGDRLIVGNATGCSSIYGGNLPTTPWAKNAEGRGPTWSNSLFEDTAEFAMGFRTSVDKQQQYAAELVIKLASKLGDDLVTAIINADQKDESDIFDQRERVSILKKKLKEIDLPEARALESVADMLVKKSVWAVGGDGWAYDIGYSGLDHVVASGKNVNLLVLDTEVYSNTGGQASKATPRGAVAKFAASGRPSAKKDLGLIAMTYGNCYVASVAMGARDEHTLRAFIEAEAFEGPSLIIAYSHCVAHGINMTTAMHNQKAAVESAQWMLYRYNPDRVLRGENPLQLDSRPPKIPVAQYLDMENRFRMLKMTHPDIAKDLYEKAQADATARWELYQYLAARKYEGGEDLPLNGETDKKQKIAAK